MSETARSGGGPQLHALCELSGKGVRLVGGEEGGRVARETVYIGSSVNYGAAGPSGRDVKLTRCLDNLKWLQVALS